MRFYEIDLIKGLAVISMVIFHVFYMGQYMNKMNVNTSKGFYHLLARFAHCTFIICMGINSVLTYQNNKKKGKNKIDYYKKVLKRFCILLFISLIISFSSYLAFGYNLFIKFGIFHYMSIASIITSLFVDKPDLSVITIILIQLLNKNISINKYVDFALGSNIRFNSLDYFPILKWLPLSLFGVILGNILYKDYHRNFDIFNIDHLLENNYFINYISILGSKTILIYLTHFPLIYSLLK